LLDNAAVLAFSLLALVTGGPAVASPNGHAASGKVSFQATATIVGARDALPADNSFSALATRVK
jgi:hypothetical protein